MLNIIPAIDILDGKVVRLTQGDYDRSQSYNYTPTELAKYYEDHGATRIHLVDLNGAKEGTLTNKTVFEKIRSSVSCDLQLGGGIRTKESVSQLFEIGINSVIIGSLLTKDFDLATSLPAAFPNKIIAGIDAENNIVKIEGWKKESSITVTSLLSKIEHLPWNSVVATDISKDGMLEGPNLEFLKTLKEHTSLPLIASGGVTVMDDIQHINSLNIFGCIVGKALLHHTIDITKLWSKT
jgi:phosphoribosylformimino-5-aminoimidazole carboxamide ribotide isomerase